MNLPDLEIEKNDDGTYLINVGIYRLTTFEDCVGLKVNDRIEFSTYEGVITGVITLDDDYFQEMIVFFGESKSDGAYLFTIKNDEAIQIVSWEKLCIRTAFT